MSEVLVIVPVRRSFSTSFLSSMWLVLTVFSLLLFCPNILALFLAMIFSVLWYVTTFHSGKEYEYSFCDEEVQFAKITNKSRRKTLCTYSMDEVIQVAPEGDRSVFSYENDRQNKLVDYSSHRNRPCYDMVVQRSGNVIVIRFEPDDDFLDAIARKYQQKLVRREIK